MTIYPLRIIFNLKTLTKYKYYVRIKYKAVRYQSRLAGKNSEKEKKEMSERNLLDEARQRAEKASRAAELAMIQVNVAQAEDALYRATQEIRAAEDKVAVKVIQAQKASQAVQAAEAVRAEAVEALDQAVRGLQSRTDVSKAAKKELDEAVKVVEALCFRMRQSEEALAGARISLMLINPGDEDSFEPESEPESGAEPEVEPELEVEPEAEPELDELEAEAEPEAETLLEKVGNWLKRVIFTDSGTFICPVCKKMTPAGEFCEQCGGEL